MVFLGFHFNSLKEIYSLGVFTGFIMCFLIGLFSSLEEYLFHRTMYYFDKRKELKNRK